MHIPTDKEYCLPLLDINLISLNFMNSVNELFSINAFCNLFHQIVNLKRSVKHLFTNLKGREISTKNRTRFAYLKQKKLAKLKNLLVIKSTLLVFI